MFYKTAKKVSPIALRVPTSAHRVLSKTPAVLLCKAAVPLARRVLRAHTTTLTTSYCTTSPAARHVRTRVGRLLLFCRALPFTCSSTIASRLVSGLYTNLFTDFGYFSRCAVAPAARLRHMGRPLSTCKALCLPHRKRRKRRVRRDSRRPRLTGEIALAALLQATWKAVREIWRVPGPTWLTPPLHVLLIPTSFATRPPPFLAYAHHVST